MEKTWALVALDQIEPWLRGLARQASVSEDQRAKTYLTDAADCLTDARNYIRDYA